MPRTLAPPLFSWFAAGWERDRRSRHRWVLCAALATSACTTWQQLPLPLVDAACRAWSQALDAAVAQAGVTDAEADRIAGAPGLRVDRAGQALRALDPMNDDAYRAWLRRAAALDEAARTAEIANLPQTAFPLRSGETIAEDRQAARERTDDCRRRAVQQWAGAALPQREALLARAEVPDRYNPALRALGLYPLVRWPFLAGVQRWQDRHQAAMARWAENPPPSQSYAPGGAQAGSATPPPWPPPVDALGLPQPAPEVARQLLAWHAPVFRIQQRGTHDHFGVPQWTGSGQPRVDTDRPVVWHRLSHARLGGVWRLQLVYTLW
ncbi:MAG: hypothetical protein FGM55_16845, partial [Rhodoferax sp.]|nr:hypothetical protein [Rhodoferax sp.]